MALFTSWWALWARVPDFITADWTQNDKHKPNIVNVVKYFNQKRLKEQGSALDILNETASYIGFESGRHGKMISAGIEGSTQRLTDRELWKWKVLPVIYYDDLDYGRRICLRSKYSGQYISSRGGDVGQSKFCGTAPELWRIERYDEDDDHPIGSVGPVQAGDRICLYSEAMHKYVGAIGSDDFGLQDHCRSDESFVVHAAWNDADQDRVIDQGDNCPNTYNPEQTDADENGVGDLCQPVVALCKDVTVSADDECQAHADIDAGSYDPRGNAVTLGYAPEGPYGLGDNDVRLTVTDSLGLSASCSASVTVIDSTPPQFSVTPGPIVVEQTSWDGTPVTVPEPEVQDNCSTVTVDHDAPDVFPLGTTTVTLTAVDAVGNVATATTTVTVQDTTPSILSDVPAPVEVEQVDGDGTPVTLGLPKAWDICDAAPVVTSNAPAVFPLGLTTVTFTATDASGNRATAATTVSVVDTKPPVISSVTASPSELWPPNGKMVSVRVTASAYDIAMHVPSA